MTLQKQIKSIFFFLIILGIFLGILYSPANAQTSGSVSLSPAIAEKNLNEAFEIAIKADSAGESISTLQLTITYPYDPNNKDLEPQGTTLTNPTSLLEFAAKTITVSSDKVTIYISAHKPGGVILPTDTTIATIPLKGLKAVANKQITISKDPAASFMFKASDNVNILYPANIHDGTYTIKEQALNSGSVSLSPATAEKNINEAFEIAIKADSAGQSISTLQLTITYPYDSNNIDLEPQGTSLTNPTTLLDFANNTISKSADKVIIYISAHKPGGVILPTDTTIATIPLKGLKAVANKQITISKDPAASFMFRTIDSVNILGTANLHDGIYTVKTAASNNLPVIFSFDSIDGDKGNKILEKVSVVKKNSSGNVETIVNLNNITTSWSTENQGYLTTVDLTGFANGNLDFYLKGYYHLNQLFSQKPVVKGQTLNLKIPPLPGGDLNEDNKVDQLDINILNPLYNPLAAATNCTPPKPLSETGFACHADINDDQFINALDYSIIIKNYNQQGAQTPS